MQLGLLGSMYMAHAGVNTAPTAPKLRTVLAVMIVHADQTVPTAALIRDLWHDRPPASGLATLQTYILNLRKLLASVLGVQPAAVSRDLLVTRAGGYLFQTGDCVIDVQRYHELMARGRRALCDEDLRPAVDMLTEALALWRGAALVDVLCGPILESKRSQLEESRLVLMEYLVDAQMRLGMYREVLTELAALTTENPLHEGLQAQYMRALYLSDRRAQALDVYHRLRKALIRELGLEPSAEVQRLHFSILTADDGVAEQMLLRRPMTDLIRTTSWGTPRHY